MNPRVAALLVALAPVVALELLAVVAFLNFALSSDQNSLLIAISISAFSMLIGIWRIRDWQRNHNDGGNS